MPKKFFTSEVIESYVNYKVENKPLIKDYLGGFELLNYQQFMDWWNDYPKDLDVDEDRMKRILLDEFGFTCGFNIGSGYIQTSIDNISDFDTFDILVAVYKKDEVKFKENTTVYMFQHDKMNRVSGFLNVERGECKKRPNIVSRVLSSVLPWNKNSSPHHNVNYNLVYSVRLICCRKRYHIEKIPTFKCQILLGAYLFVIKSNPDFPQIGILECADGYKNISGFITYSNLGFVKDLSLYKYNCFYALGNLPMSNDITRIDKESIVQYASKDLAHIVPPDVRELLNFYQQNQNDEKKQRALAAHYNLFYKVEIGMDEIINILGAGPDDDGDYNELQEYIGWEEFKIYFNILINNKDLLTNIDENKFVEQVRLKLQEVIMERIEKILKPYREQRIEISKKRSREGSSIREISKKRSREGSSIRENSRTRSRREISKKRSREGSAIIEKYNKELGETTPLMSRKKPKYGAGKTIKSL